MEKSPRYTLVAIPGAWVVNDTTPPGGRTVAQHGEKARAVAVLNRLNKATAPTKKAKPAPAPSRTPSPEEPAKPEEPEEPAKPAAPTHDPEIDARLNALLDNSVRTVRRLIKKAPPEDLPRLLALEVDGAGRGPIIDAITSALR